MTKIEKYFIYLEGKVKVKITVTGDENVQTLETETTLKDSHVTMDELSSVIKDVKEQSENISRFIGGKNVNSLH